MSDTPNPRFTFRITSQDRERIVALKEHMRKTTTPLVSYADAIRHALQVAERVLLENHEARQ